MIICEISIIILICRKLESVGRVRHKIQLPSPNIHYDFAPVLSKKFLDIQATIECRFTLKSVRSMIRTYSIDNIDYI